MLKFLVDTNEFNYLIVNFHRRQIYNLNRCRVLFYLFTRVINLIFLCFFITLHYNLTKNLFYGSPNP